MKEKEFINKLIEIMAEAYIKSGIFEEIERKIIYGEGGNCDERRSN